jgi:peptidoglycan/xylan/chitin deacetylase (PgdA/CDA1 family)
MKEMAPPNDVRSELQHFFDGLASQSGIEAEAVTRLSPFTFQVTYNNRSPTRNEIDHFGMNDFPVYLLTTTGSESRSTDDILSLLDKHKIPETIFVWRRLGPSQTQRQTNSVDAIKADWTAKPNILGFGFPGPYFLQTSQNFCRKLGIIKMRGEMVLNVQPSDLQPKLVSVLKHELGHMFGNDHVSNTIMDEQYNTAVANKRYTNDQLVIIGRALEVLRQN